jgi:hypothetical protein
MKSAAAATARHLYKALLHLYPSAFRSEFGDEMAYDFEEATGEAWTIGGWTTVLVVWTTFAHDLIRSVVVQWMRSGAPILVAASAVWTISFCVLIAQGVPRDISLPQRNPDEDMRLMLMGFAVVLLVIVATILITGLFWMSVVKRRSRA